jgi:adenylate kinase
MKKKWKNQKIMENINAEALDVILCEAVELHPKNNIFEIDTTNINIEEVAASIVKISKKNFQPTKTYNIGRIDWSEEILKGFQA